MGIHEHLLKKDVKNWNDGDNELLIYVSEMKNGHFQVKVGIKLDGEIIKTMIDVTQNVNESIENLCIDLHILLSNQAPYDLRFHYESTLI